MSLEWNYTKVKPAMGLSLGDWIALWHNYTEISLLKEPYIVLELMAVIWNALLKSGYPFIGLFIMKLWHFTIMS